MVSLGFIARIIMFEKIHWPGVVMLGLFLGAAIAALALGNEEIAALLGGAAAGQFFPSPKKVDQ